MKKIFLAVIILLIATCVFADILTDYVYKTDPSFDYKIIEKTKDGDSDVIAIDMTSQTWQNMPIKNTVVIIYPKNTKITDTAVLLNTGGAYKSGTLWAKLGVQMSKLVSCPICIVFDIPNQPMWGKKEDALMSHTFKQAFDENNFTEKPLLLQMAKAVIKSMDVIETVSSGYNKPIKKFIITGASKRGWTSWISAGTKDKRIVAIMPIVFDWLDMKKQINHQKEYYGTTSAQIGDYTQFNFDELLYRPEAKTMVELIDPFYYNVSIPKLIINASNDQYWTLDSAGLYYNNLKGEKYLFYKPNAKHDMGLLKFSDDPMSGFFEILPMINDMKIFIDHVCLGSKMNNIKYTWAEKKGKITCTINAEEKPESVICYTKDQDKRDFRDTKWDGKELSFDDKKIVYTRDVPASGYCGTFIEVKFKNSEGTPYSVFTTPYVK